MRILIDTNVYLRFYDSTNETLGVLDELLKHSDKMILSEQVLTEFRRNRITILRNLAESHKKPSEIKGIPNTPLAKAIPAFEELFESKEKFLKASSHISETLFDMIENADLDPVAQKVEAIYACTDSLSMPITEEDYSSAQRRKLLGNPPISPDKSTIGDEVIWEGILSLVQDDLVFVTGDRAGFQTFEPILTQEFDEISGGKRLHIVESCSEAIKKAGENVPKKVAEAEKKDISRHEAKTAIGATGGANPFYFIDREYAANLNRIKESLYGSSSIIGSSNYLGYPVSGSSGFITFCNHCHGIIPANAPSCVQCGKKNE